MQRWIPGITAGAFSLFHVGYGLFGVIYERFHLPSKWVAGSLQEYSGYEAIFLGLFALNLGLGLLAYAIIITWETLDSVRVIRFFLLILVTEIVVLTAFFSLRA